jgi:hypothetical protein
VPPRDPVRAADALESVLRRGRAAFQPALARAAADHRWPTVAEPLVRWVLGASMPARLGAGIGARAGVRPAQRARAVGHRMARAGLNAAGLRDWPPYDGVTGTER